jgi:hypothetical protein
MKKHFFALFFVLLSITACSNESFDDFMEQFLWKNRLIVVLAPERASNKLAAQLKELAEDPSGLKERDVRVFEVVYEDFVKLDGKLLPWIAAKHFHKYFKADKKKFSVVLVGMDGEVKERLDKPISSKKLFEKIDEMPLRRDEKPQE